MLCSFLRWCQCRSANWLLAHINLFLNMCECFCLERRYGCHVHAVPKKARRGQPIIWNGSYRRLYRALRIKPKRSARAGSSLNHHAISPAPSHVNLDIAFVSVPPLPLSVYHVTTDKRPLTHQELMKPMLLGGFTIGVPFWGAFGKCVTVNISTVTKFHRPEILCMFSLLP